MPDLFRAYQVRDAKIPTYLIESSAPINIDDSSSPPALPDRLTPLDAQEAIHQIAGHLRTVEEPNLVVMVHGFNNPESAVLRWFARASAAIEADDRLVNRSGLVCVGYRWPSERMGQPLLGTVAAMPAPLRAVLCIGLSLFFAYLVLRWASFISFQSILGLLAAVLGLAGLLLIGAFVAAAFLRAIVYFRDGHRAANYGAADLIEIIRQIDRATTSGEPITRRNYVQLSFIGHSMGAFVVTNAIRSLSDLFAVGAIRPSINAGVADATSFKKLPPHIGNAFELRRFVLASPDIPAETLLSNRANYLAASLLRFQEAFSNEGDEVLMRPWGEVLARLRGRTSSSGDEWITTTEVFDALRIPEPARASVARKVASCMRSHGWSKATVGPRSARRRGYKRLPIQP